MQRGFLDPGAPLLVGRLHPEHQPANPGAPRGLGLPSSSCLAGTPSRARNVTSLVVTGTMTDICVLATVMGAFHREYRVTVVEDGVSTLWPQIQRATLDIIGRAYGRIATAKEVSDQISSWSQ
jgi:nicotinamidase-related amidase